MVSLYKFPILKFTPEAWEKLQFYLRFSAQKISGFCRVIDYPNELIVIDTFQIGTLSISSFMEQLVESGDDPAEMKLFWQSHADIKVSLGTDNEWTIQEPSELYMFHLSGNRNGEVKINLEFINPRVSLYNYPFEIDYEYSRYADECRRNMEQNATVAKSLYQCDLRGILPTYLDGFFN